MKKLISLLLAMIMVFSLAATAFADETGDGVTDPNPNVTITDDMVVEVTTNITNRVVMENGTITINGVSEENVYAVYKMLHLESFDEKSGAYSYRVVKEWKDFFNKPEIKKYMHADANGYITWIAGDTDAIKATFAKLALEYAKDEKNNIDPVRISKGENGSTTQMEIIPGESLKSGKFKDLTMGYFLIDSTMGALCGLTTTNPDASINAKNSAPTIDKQVMEDSTEQWGDTNTADIGQTVYFRTTISVHAGAENYILHDTMSEGLTFQKVSKIDHVVPSTNKTTEVPSTMYEVLTPGTNHDENKTCTFEVKFTQEFCDHLQTNDKVIVYYEAMLNRNAIVAGTGNNNKAQLEFGEDHLTTEDETVTKTFGFDLIKTDSQNKLIDGAEFRIYDSLNGGKEIGVVPLKATCADNPTEKDYLKDVNGQHLLFDLNNDGKAEERITHISEYRRARPDEEAAKVNCPIIVTDGIIRVVGFDNGTYYLEETVAPDGYNKLSGRKSFIISDSNLDAIFNDTIYSSGSGVQVVNKTGSMLPETGAMGTTMFLFFGTFAVLATGVLLVTKKRMTMIED